MVRISIKNCSYYIAASSVKAVLDTAKLLGLPIDKAEMSFLSERNILYKAWGINELFKHLKKERKL